MCCQVSRLGQSCGWCSSEKGLAYVDTIRQWLLIGLFELSLSLFVSLEMSQILCWAGTSALTFRFLHSWMLLLEFFPHLLLAAISRLGLHREKINTRCFSPHPTPVLQISSVGKYFLCIAACLADVTNIKNCELYSKNVTFPYFVRNGRFKRDEGMLLILLLYMCNGLTSWLFTVSLPD